MEELWGRGAPGLVVSQAAAGDELYPRFFLEGFLSREAPRQGWGVGAVVSPGWEV